MSLHLALHDPVHLVAKLLQFLRLIRIRAVIQSEWVLGYQFLHVFWQPSWNGEHAAKDSHTQFKRELWDFHTTGLRLEEVSGHV